MSILFSVLARRPRDAILATYVLGVLWLLTPSWLAGISRYLDGALVWVPPVVDCLILTNPIRVWSAATLRPRVAAAGYFQRDCHSEWGTVSFEGHFAIMAVTRRGCSDSFCVVLAVAGLRPLRGSAWPGAKPETGWFTRIHARYRQFVEARATAALMRNELLAARANRPPCSDHPMHWKERFTRMGGGLRWLGSRPVALFFMVLLGCYLFDLFYPLLNGPTQGWWNDWTWVQINSALRNSSSILAALTMLPVAAAAAASITSEREQDTWTSLATTLLTPREIIGGKQYGAIWSARWLGIGLAVLMGVGLFMGAFHPLGVLASLAVLFSSAWLTAAIGVLASTPGAARPGGGVLHFLCGVRFRVDRSLAGHLSVEAWLHMPKCKCSGPERFPSDIPDRTSSFPRSSARPRCRLSIPSWRGCSHSCQSSIWVRPGEGG